MKVQGYRMPVGERRYLLPRELTGSQYVFLITDSLPVPASSPTIPISWGNPHPKLAGFTMQNTVYLNVQCDVVCRASFQELENAHVNYDTVQWCLISCLFILVYGVGLLLLLYVPVRRYIVRKDIQNRELYVTTQAVVYKVTAAFHVYRVNLLIEHV